MGSAAIKHRVFLVGCPRSGTTLLQSMLAAHPQIISFPESHFFRRLVPRVPWLGALGIVSQRARPRFARFLREIGQDAMLDRLPRGTWSMRRYVRTFVEVLDTLAEQQGNGLWLEKTPDHVFSIDIIEKYVPNAQFIHLVRDGKDVVASLYEVTRDFPDTWGRPWTIERCIKKWNTGLRHTRRHLGKPDHFLVRYERLVESTEPVLKQVCCFLGVGFCDAMLFEHHEAAKSLITKAELWKNDARRGLRTSPSGKFERLFNERQRSFIIDNLESLDDLPDKPSDLLAGRACMP